MHMQTPKKLSNITSENQDKKFIKFAKKNVQVIYGHVQLWTEESNSKWMGSCDVISDVVFSSSLCWK